MTLYTTGYGQGTSALDDLMRLQDEFNRYFDGRITRYPPVNVWLSEDSLVVDVELPGVNTKDVDIRVHGNQLTVSGRTQTADSGQAKNAVYYKRERVTGEFSRSLDLPFTPDPAKLTANYKHGVLRITVPRAESDKPRRIKIETVA